MIPRRLIIKGLYSYQEQQEIDFSGLLKSRIFGIFGSTGSGKSSLVEAISMALYGESGRLHARDNRQYNMMNLKSNELLIDFEFMTGTPSKIYRAVVNARRNSKNFSNITKWERRAFEQQNDEWIPIELESLEKIIGLSSENFHRTIIIPQGKFQEFLELTGTERTRMLRELFDLGKYELSYKVAAIEKKNEADRNHVLGQLTSLEAYTDESHQSLSEDLSLVETNLNAMTGKWQNMQAEELKLSAAAQIHQQFKDSVQAYDELFSKSDGMKSLLEKIEKYRLCTKFFAAPMADLKRIEKSLSDLQIESEKFVKERIQWQSKLAELDEKLKLVQPVYLLTPEFKEEIRGISLIFEMRKAEEERDSLEDSRRKGLVFVNEKREELEKLLASQLKLKNEKEEVLKGSLSADDTMALSSWHQKYSSVLQRLKETENRKAEKVKRLNEFQEQYYETLGVFGIKVSGFDEDASLINQHINDLEQSIIKADENANILRRSKHLAEYAEVLVEGSPCPLCGSEHHPDVYNNSDVFKQLLEIEKNIQDGKTRLKVMENARAAAVKIGERIQETKSELISLEKDLESIKEQEVSLLSLKPDGVALDEIPARIEKSMEVIRRVGKEIDPALAALEVQITNLQGTLDKARQRFDELDREISRFAERAMIHAQQAGESLINRYKNVQAGDLKIKIEEIELRIQKANLDFNTLNSLISDAMAEAQKLEGIILGNISRKAELEVEEAKVRSRLAELLEEYSFTKKEEVEAVLHDSFDVDLASGQWHQWSTRLEAAQLAKSQWSKLAESSPYDGNLHDAFKVQMTELHTALESSRQHNAVLRKQVEDSARKLDEKKILVSRIDILQKRFDNIKVLKAMFAASGFVNFTSSVYLHSLVNAANERFFQLSGRTLRIELSDDNSFVVRDYMNNGHIRSIKTLSGGQKFQASLSLALALADSLQHQRQAVENFFFLDEGFGSLDKESLYIVFDTLKALRLENRIVGVISHVEDLQQEIESHIRVINDPEQGSRISIHY
ncbi:MAG: AAA family ATPase [Bacteroidales bacterium]|jgi:exonuclease SbcC|nr:AAA family ATPase [Bacteroidales bacterium]